MRPLRMAHSDRGTYGEFLYSLILVTCELFVNGLKAYRILDNIVVVPDFICRYRIRKIFLSIQSINTYEHESVNKNSKECPQRLKVSRDMQYLLLQLLKRLFKDRFEWEHDLAQILVLKFLALQLGPFTFPDQLGKHPDFFEIATQK